MLKQLMRSVVIGGVVGINLIGCTLGPDFEMDAAFESDQIALPEAPLEAVTLPTWQQIYRDPHLQILIGKALENNYDLKIAQAKIIESMYTNHMAKASLWPDLGLESTLERSGNPASTANNVELNAVIGWELDFFGKAQRTREASLAQYGAVKQARQAIELSLIARVAEQFFDLKGIEEELSISQSTIRIRAKELDLARLRKNAGVISGLEQRQAEVELESAKVNVPRLKLAKRQALNNLTLLVGSNITQVSGGNSLSTQYIPTQLTDSISSHLLIRRPDVQKAKLEWHAATAQVGVAEAGLWPDFSLTSEFGGQSDTLSDIVSRNAFNWQFGLDIAAPIFNAGKNSANLSAAEQRAYQAKLNYERSVLSALHDVSNSLAAFESSQTIFSAQRSLVYSSQEYLRLAQLRYRNGVASSLDLMDAQRQLFSAQIGLVKAKNEQLNSLTYLYKALGGGY